MQSKRHITVLSFACWASLSAAEWRQYSVYQPKVEIGYIYDGAKGKFKYNHCATAAWYRGRWFALWNANTIPIEGKPGQPVVLATSSDFKAWTAPSQPFNDPRHCENPVKLGKGRQWQPNLLVHGDELWCIWGQSSGGDKGTYFSVLRDPDGKWVNRKLDFGDEMVIEGVRYDRLFPTQNPIILRSGRVLAPLNVMGPRMEVKQDVKEWRRRMKRDTVIFTDDGGKTWHLSPGTTIAENPWAVWEPTVWECDDGAVRMLARNNNWNPVAKGGDPATRMLTKSVSHDQGSTWSLHEFVPIETISSRMHVLPVDGERFAMVHNDWHKGKFAADRQNLALFFNRGGGWDFVPGINVSGRDTRVAYPQMFIKDDAIHTAYTRQGSPSSMRWSRVSPLPKRGEYYLFPRSNTPPAPQPWVEDGSLVFAAWQRIETRWQNRAGEGDLSIGMWVKPQRTGVLFDTRGPGMRGLLFHIIATESGISPVAFLSTKEWNIEPELRAPVGEWCYLGLSIDNRAGQVHFFVNGQTDTRPFVPPAPLTSSTGYFGFKRFEGSRVPGLIGRIRWATVFQGRCLSPAQHRSLFNTCAGDFGRTDLPDAVPVPPADCVLDPSELGWGKSFRMPAERATRAEAVERDGKHCLRFNGDASAGIDLDQNRPAQGDVVVLEFAFELDAELAAEDEIVLCTTGGGERPLRVVVHGNDPGTVQVRIDGNCRPVGILSGRAAAIHLRISSDACAVAVDGQEPVAVPFATTDTWLFLGQGYLEGRVPATKSFTVDVASVRSRVILVH